MRDLRGLGSLSIRLLTGFIPEPGNRVLMKLYLRSVVKERKEETQAWREGGKEGRKERRKEIK